MKSPLTFLAHAVLGLALVTGLSAQADDAKKVDPTGTWTWSVPGRDGGPARTSTLKLKMADGKLTGTVSGRQSDSPIEDAKLSGDEISFKVVREFNGNKFTQNYKGKVGADSIKGKIEFERNGEAQSRDWEAKREAAKKE